MSEKQPSWPDGMDAADRVRHVVLTRTTPRNAGWIATEANVFRDTAVKYLSRMVYQGDLKTVETREGTCYKPDPVMQFLDPPARSVASVSKSLRSGSTTSRCERPSAWRSTPRNR